MMRNKLFSIFLIIFFIVPLASFAAEGDPVAPWPYTSNPSASHDQAQGIAVDNNGIYVSGFSRNPSGYNDMYVEKINHDKTLGWQQYLNVNLGVSSSSNTNIPIAIDSTGVYISGNDQASPGDYRWRIEKRSLVDGSLLWPAPIMENVVAGAGTQDYANAIAVYGGFVYIGGGNDISNSAGAPWRIEKRDASNGAIITTRDIPVAVSGQLNQINSVVVDSTGVYVTGTFNTGSRVLWKTMKLSSVDLSTIWATDSTNAVFTNVTNIALDLTVDATSVYVAGGQDWIVGRLDKSTGDDIDTGCVSCWYKKEIASAGYTWPYSVEADGFGSVFTAGFYQTASTGYEWKTEKMRGSDGTVLAPWPKFDDPSANHDVARALKIFLTNPNQGIYVSGWDALTGSSNTEIRVQKREYVGGCSPLGAFSWTSGAISPGSQMRASHITELRSNIDTLRASAGLLSYPWVDTIISGTVVKASHIEELRTALNDVYTKCGQILPTYTDSPLTAGTSIKAAHMTELRTSVDTAP